MNKFWGGGVDGNVVVCVLEPGNIHKLTNGEPIDINLNDGPWKRGLPAKVHVVIGYSETPVTDAKTFRRLNPTVPFEDQRTPVSEAKRPHCPECKSSIEQLGVWRSDESPLWLTFCPMCGCVFGVSRPIEGLERTK